jgi:hypothetical protein
MRRVNLIGVFAALAVAAPMLAQGKSGKGRGVDGVPPGHRPPAGMCRIWIDGVPPGQQPTPTDCATAVARRPANARVIWGDETPFPGQGKNRSSDERCTIDQQRTGSISLPWPIGSADTAFRRRAAEKCRSMEQVRDRDRDDDRDRELRRQGRAVGVSNESVRASSPHGKNRGKGKGR